jgi:hypothetical protein
MPERCRFPLCKSWATDNGLCTSHGKYFNTDDFKGVAKAAPSSKPVKKSARKPVKKKSAKRVNDEKEYKKILAEMMAENDNCELKVPGVCTGKMQGGHHMKKRQGNYLKRKYILRACNACNGWAELHPLEAVEMGISLSVHKIQS